MSQIFCPWLYYANRTFTSDTTFEGYVVNFIYEHFITKLKLLFMLLTKHLNVTLSISYMTILLQNRDCFLCVIYCFLFVCLFVCCCFFIYVFLFLLFILYMYTYFLTNCKLHFINYISQSISFVVEIFAIGF